MAQNQHNRLSIIFNPFVQRYLDRRSNDVLKIVYYSPAHQYLFLPFVCIFLFLFPSNVRSETILLKSGKSVEGTIKERTDKFIIVDVGLGFPITYYLDEIKQVEGEAAGAESTAQLSAEKEADRLEQKGLDLIEEGRMDEGLDALQKAIELSPKANRHLNLGSILFGNGVSRFKQDQKKKALAVFKKAQDELSKSIELFDEKTDGMFLSQAYFMMGEMNAQGFENKKKARTFYERSIFFYPNPAAERGLKALDQQ